MLWIPEARVVHKEGKSTGADERFRKLSDLAFRYIARNSLLYTRKHFPYCLPTVLLFNAFESIRYFIAGNRRKLQVFRDAVQEFWSISR